jgi:hypothetical protein
MHNKNTSSINEGSAEDVMHRQTIAKALVAMTEIWLTDLWYAVFKPFYLS